MLHEARVKIKVIHAKRITCIRRYSRTKWNSYFAIRKNSWMSRSLVRLNNKIISHGDLVALSKQKRTETKAIAQLCGRAMAMAHEVISIPMKLRFPCEWSIFATLCEYYQFRLLYSFAIIDFKVLSALMRAKWVQNYQWYRCKSGQTPDSVLKQNIGKRSRSAVHSYFE